MSEKAGQNKFRSKIMRLISFLLIAIFLFILVPVPMVSAQTAQLSPAQIAEFEEFVKKQMEADKVPGLSIGFINGDTVWSRGFGFADLENKIPAKAESMYRLASVTKPMTAAAILQLVEKGKINLDAEVQTYVPYFPKKNFPITIRQLLGHLGGLSHYKNFDLEGHFKDHKNTRESIAVFENFDLVAEPGTRFNYSSYGYNLLGAVIEGASGQAYADYMRDNIWKPLGMETIRMDSPSDVIPNRVRGYELANGKIRNAEFVDVSSRFSAGGTRANVFDLLKFGQGLEKGKVLSKTSLDLMFNSMSTKSGVLTGYSAGWNIFPTNGRFFLSHSGGQQETSTYLFSFPARKIVIAVAANLEDANTGVYAQKLFEFLTGETWNTNAYINNERNKLPIYLALVGSFEEGRAVFEKNGKPFSDNSEDLAKAFAYFNQNLNYETLISPPKPDIFRKVSSGRQPNTGQPFARIGSYVADKLKQKYGMDKLNDYSNTGAITFFNDYIELYQKDANIPKEFRFNQEVEKTIALWQTSWTKTNTAEMRKLVISPDSNFEELGAKLKNEFGNASVYPNYAEGLNNALKSLAVQGQIAKAVKVGELATELYPELDATNAYYGMVLVLSGDKEKGKRFLKQAVSLNGNSLANPTGLITTAYNLAGAGMTDAGLTLLQAASELYPGDVNLYDSLGDFYAKKKMNDKAIEFYQKALAINPGYQNAEKAKEILKKLSGEQ
jgi:CubicO group peptidase (beta-lactamase class C family)